MALVDLVKVSLNSLFGKAPVAGAIERSVQDRLFEDAVWVTDYGAKGNYNPTTGTGADSTAAIQSAINNLGATYRNGGLRRIYFPAGNYKITALSIPKELEFGVMFCGSGMFSSIIWADGSNSAPAISSEIDFVHFQDLGLYGALQQTTTDAIWKSCFYRGKHYNKAPDIDVTFRRCALGHAKDFAQVHGRGFVVDGTCVAFFCNYLLNIVADPEVVFPGGATNSVGTGARNYYVSPQRCDVVSRLFRVTGTGAWKDHINDIVINGVNALSSDRIGEFTDATVTGLTIAACSFRNSFSGPLLVGKRLIDSSIDVNSAKNFDRNTASTARMHGIVQVGSAERVRIQGNYRELCDNALKIDSLSVDVSIDIDVFSLGADGSDFTAVKGASVNGLDVCIRTSGIAPAGVCRFFVEGTQASPTFRCYSTYNSFVRPAVVFTPTLYVGASVMPPGTGGARGEVQMINGEQYQRIYWAGPGTSAASSEVSLTLSGTPLTDLPGYSSVLGKAEIGNTSYTQGLTARIDASTNRIVFYKPSGTRLLGTDLPANFSISVDVRIRTQQVL